jgi:hypothetical protein
VLNPGGTHTHHHGMLAGLGAGTAAVLACMIFVLSVWHRVSGTVAQAVVVLVWALVAAFLAGAVYVVVFLGLRLRHHVAHPETLTRHTVRAEVIPPPVPAPAIPAPEPLAALPPPSVTHNWNLPQDPDAAAAVIRSIADSTAEGN